jgi:MFS transporter, PPP family, 3-phenylpropionic acid transporter
MRRLSGPMSFGFAPRLAAYYAALFVVVGIQLPFFPLWLRAKGLDAQAIGVVLAVPMVVRIFAIPAAARAAERHGALRGAMVAALAAATLGYLLVGFANGFLAIAVMFGLASAALSPAMPLAETYALKGLGQRGRTYGPVRLWGSVAFIAGTYLAGAAIDVMPARHLIWLIVAAVALSAMSAALLEPVGLEPAAAREGHTRRWLSDPLFLSVVAGASLIQGSHAVYYGFSALAWTQSGLGGSAIATLWALGVAAEIVLFAVQGRMPAYVTPAMLVVIGGAGAALRWLAMAFNPPAALLPVLQLLHGLSFGATHLGALGYISRAAPEGRGATAQGFYAIVLGAVMAAMTGLSGWLFGRYGELAYAAMALAAAGGCVCAAVAHQARRRALL